MKPAGLACLVGVLVLATASLAADLEVGPGKPYASIEDAYAAAGNGDNILVYPLGGGAAYQQVALYITKSNLTVRGVTTNGSRVPLSGQGYDYSGVGSTPRAMFQFNPGADGCTVENLEVSGCRNGSHNGAGFRINQANDTTVRNCEIHSNDMGMMSNGSVSDGTAENQLIEDCLIHDNGNTDDPGYNHNLYLGGASVTLRGCDVHSSTTGHNVKSRAHVTILQGCYIHDSSNREMDLVDSSGNTVIPGSHALVSGCVIAKDPACDGNKTVIHFGQDGSADHNGTLHLIHTTILTPFISPVVDLSSLNAGVRFENCLVMDPSGSASNQVLVQATRNGASTENSKGSHLWMSSGFVTPADGTFSDVTRGAPGERPAFLDEAGGDYHLADAYADVVDAGAPVPDASLPVEIRGVAPMSFTPPLGSAPRSFVDAPDLGAYEYIGDDDVPPAAPANLQIE